MRVTQFKCIGVGYVITNKKVKEKTIEFFLPEQSNMRDGVIKNDTVDLKFEVSDINDMQRSGKITTSNTNTASWLPMGSHKVEPPSVRRGERVLIYTVGDSGKYYWTEMGLDEHLRRLDSFILAISNTRDESVRELNHTNTWWLEFSTMSKKFAVYTNKSDGEQFAYQLLIDANANIARLGDDGGNMIELNSPENRIVIVNGDNTFVNVEKKTISAVIEEGPSVLLDEEDIYATNKAGSLLNLVKETVTMTSSEGGSLIINKTVSIKDADGATLELSGGNVNIGSSGGSTIAVDGAVGLNGASSVDITGSSAVNVDGGGGKIVASGGTVMSN